MAVPSPFQHPVSRALLVVTLTLSPAWIAAASDGEAGRPAPVEAAATEGATPRPPVLAGPKRERPEGLSSLYVSYGVLQMLDAHSTFRAVGAGGREVNPLFSNLSGSPVAVLTIKAGVTAATIVAAERVWKKHPAAAMMMMIAVNSAYAAIVAHNYRLASSVAGR